jgi:TolB protein
VAGEPGVFDIGLSLVNRDGTNKRPLLPASARRDIAVINADGTGLRFLTRTAALETEPVWSPDGTMIAFASDRHVNRGRRLDRNGPAFEIYTMRADGSDVRRITRNRVPDLYPDWQPRP